MIRIEKPLLARFPTVTVLLARGRASLLVVIPALALVCIFLLDLYQPAEVVFSILYVAPILLTVRLGLPRTTYLVFVVSSVATVAAAAFGPIPGHPTVALANRALALIAQVLAAAVVIQQLERQERVLATSTEHAELVAVLRAQERLKEDFVAMATHELRSPVTTLRGYTQIMQAGVARTGSPDLSAIAGKMLRQIDRLNRLVGELLDVSRTDGGRMPLYRAALDLGTLAREGVEHQRAASPGWIIDFALDCPLPVWADAQRVEQVLSNLLDNALKYSPHGGAVRVRAWQEANEACLAVTDHGIGIARDEQERLFERFFRGHGAAHHTGGLGVGLYISRRIIADHGGRMWVESAPGQGSTFGFALPLDR